MPIAYDWSCIVTWFYELIRLLDGIVGFTNVVDNHSIFWIHLYGFGCYRISCVVIKKGSFWIAVMLYFNALFMLYFRGKFQSTSYKALSEFTYGYVFKTEHMYSHSVLMNSCKTSKILQSAWNKNTNVYVCMYVCI